MKIKGHRQLLTIELGITLAMSKRSGRHFTHGHQPARLENITAHLLQKLMNGRPIGVITAAITFVIVRKVGVFGNQIDHVKPQAINAFIRPEMTNFLELLANQRVFPVEIRLLSRK